MKQSVFPLPPDQGGKLARRILEVSYTSAAEGVVVLRLPPCLVTTAGSTSDAPTTAAATPAPSSGPPSPPRRLRFCFCGWCARLIACRRWCLSVEAAGNLFGEIESENRVLSLLLLGHPNNYFIHVCTAVRSVAAFLPCGFIQSPWYVVFVFCAVGPSWF